MTIFCVSKPLMMHSIPCDDVLLSAHVLKVLHAHMVSLRGLNVHTVHPDFKCVVTLTVMSTAIVCYSMTLTPSS